MQGDYLEHVSVATGESEYDVSYLSPFYYFACNGINDPVNNEDMLSSNLTTLHLNKPHDGTLPVLSAHSLLVTGWRSCLFNLVIYAHNKQLR